MRLVETIKSSLISSLTEHHKNENLWECTNNISHNTSAF
jgi:hypothetical protein